MTTFQYAKAAMDLASVDDLDLSPSRYQLLIMMIEHEVSAAVEEEREACARLVEAGLEDDDAVLSDEICRRDVDLAAAIRARGQQ